MADLHLLSPRGFVASGIYAGIKTRQIPDVGLLLCAAPATAAAVFTTNKVVAAPVTVGRAHVASGMLRGVVLNSGNANACTGKQGERDARRMCELAAAIARSGCKPTDILPSSTGIIGHMLPMAKVERGIVECGQQLGDSREHALLFADAIMTTDTRRKAAYHNGTAWTWTFPVFCEALAQAWNFEPAAVSAARAYLGSMDRLLMEGCAGQLPEIVDGDAPHRQRGCDAQAWGVTEALRVWKLLQGK